MQVIRPGDTILVRLDSQITADAAAKMVEAMKERFPDCEICVLGGGVAGIDVYRPSRPESAPG